MASTSPSSNKRYRSHRKWGAEWLYHLSHSLWRNDFHGFAKIAKYINVFLFRCYIDCPAEIGAGFDLPHGGFGVVIGPRVSIGIDAIIFHGVTIGSGRPGPVLIGDRLYVGAGAKIIGPVQIGNDVSIGANAVVTFDVPAGCTVVGQKARIIPPKGQMEPAALCERFPCE